MNFKSLLVVSAAALAAVSSAEIRITEWMYNDTPEYVELTNVGGTAVDFTGWSYDDDSQTPDVFSLSGFGLVQPGESVVFTEGSEADFRTLWNLAPTVKVLGGYTNNLGRNDEINIFDEADNLVDRLTYGDQSFPGSIRTQNASGNIVWDSLGGNDVTTAVKSTVGDAWGSYENSIGQVGNPGYYAPVPEPASMAALGLGVAAMLRRRRKS